MELKPQPIPRAERVVFVVAETPAFRARMTDKLRKAGYLPREVESQQVFGMEPLFDSKGFVFFIIEAGEDKELIHQLMRHLHSHWTEAGTILVFSFWPPSFNDLDIWRMYEVDSGPRFGVMKFLLEEESFESCALAISGTLTRIEKNSDCSPRTS